MTPPARLAAAIEILDLYLAGSPLEKVLTNWARRSRYAGSGDRAAIRDIVFDCVRSRASFAARGGAETGRGLVIGYVVENHIDPAEVFTSARHAPEALSQSERARLLDPKPLAPHDALDCPKWVFGDIQDSLGGAFAEILTLMKRRAGTHLRVNLSKMDRRQAMVLLKQDEIDTEIHPLVDTALTVTSNPRRVAQSRAWRDGVIELQDAASQAVCAALPDAQRMLDYCAGGGGKALAYADRRLCEVFIHDANPNRMAHLPERMERAGVSLVQLATEEVAEQAPFDLVLCDVPCSGTGTWRRIPQQKWDLSSEVLINLQAVQQEILQKASLYLAPKGVLAYVTCSLLDCENSAQKDLFLNSNPDWRCISERQFTPLDGGDGLYFALLTKAL